MPPPTGWDTAQNKWMQYDSSFKCLFLICVVVDVAYIELTSPKTRADKSTEKKGSIALIVCVNDTATFPRLMFVKRFPIVCTHAKGRIARIWKLVKLVD
jgi:hypothetical protein